MGNALSAVAWHRHDWHLMFTPMMTSNRGLLVKCLAGLSQSLLLEFRLNQTEANSYDPSVCSLGKGEVEVSITSGSTSSHHIYQAFPPDHSLFPASGNPQIWGILGTNWGKIRGRNTSSCAVLEAGQSFKTPTSSTIFHFHRDLAFIASAVFDGFHNVAKQHKPKLKTAEVLRRFNYRPTTMGLQCRKKRNNLQLVARTKWV